MCGCGICPMASASFHRLWSVVVRLRAAFCLAGSVAPGRPADKGLRDPLMLRSAAASLSSRTTPSVMSACVRSKAQLWMYIDVRICVPGRCCGSEW